MFNLKCVLAGYFLLKVLVLFEILQKRITRCWSPLVVTIQYVFGEGPSPAYLKGHSGPVTVLADCLLGYHRAPVQASGGVDGTVRLWSTLSSNMRGRSALMSTSHGHEQSMIDLAVAERNSSLLGEYFQGILR